MRANPGRLTHLHTRLLFLGAVLMGCVFSLPGYAVAAGLTVDIIKPTTLPSFTFDTGTAYDFEAVAFAEGQELPGGEVTWEWDFGDGTAHVLTNPCKHTFANPGNWVVTVTARYGALDGQDTLNAAALPPGVAESTQLLTWPDTGGDVCDMVTVLCRIPTASLRGTGMMPYSAVFSVRVGREWQVVDHLLFETTEDGQYWEADTLWDTVGGLWPLGATFKNHVPADWLVEYLLIAPPAPGQEPQNVWGAKTATWTPDNTVLSGPPECLIKHSVGDPSHTVNFRTAHLSDETAGIVPKYHVTLTVYDLAGTEVARVTKDNVALGDGSITWTPQFAPPGQDPPEPGQTADADTIYTYRLDADHGMCGDSWPSAWTQLTDPPDVTGVSYDQANGKLVGKVRWTTNRQPGHTALRVYPPHFENPTAITVPDDANPADGVPIEITVPADKHGNYTFVVLPVDGPDGGDHNPGGKPRPSLPGGGTRPALPSAYGFQGTGTLLLHTKEMLAEAQEQQSHGPVGAFWKPPAYVSSVYDDNLALARVSYNRFAGLTDPLSRDALVFFVGHGSPGIIHTIQTTANYHRLCAGAGENSPDHDVYYLGNLPAQCLARCQCVLLVACQTAVPGPQGSSADAFKALGAGCVIGSKRDIQDAESRDFCDAFWESAMRDGSTASQALGDALYASGMSVTDWEIQGSTAPLRPAQYR